MTQSETSLRQALVAVLCAARDLGYDVDAIAARANKGVQITQDFRIAGHPHVMGSAAALEDALAIMRETPAA